LKELHNIASAKQKLTPLQRHAGARSAGKGLICNNKGEFAMQKIMLAKSKADTIRHRVQAGLMLSMGFLSG